MAFSASTWALAKRDYETGNYSVAEVEKKYSISEAAINKRIAKEKWEKGKLKEVGERNIQQKYIDAFTKRGFDENKVAKIIDEMSEAEKTVIVPSGKEGQSGFADVLPDWQARDKAITQHAKLTGSYAVEKSESKVKLEIPGLEELLKKVYPDAK